MHELRYCLQNPNTYKNYTLSRSFIYSPRQKRFWDNKKPSPETEEGFCFVTYGCLAWTRTKILRSRVSCPTIRRQGNELYITYSKY